MYLSDTMSALMSGIGTTVVITMSSVVIGFVMACLFTYFYLPSSTLFHKLVVSYCKLIKGTPLLLQLFFVYYGIGSISYFQHSIFWDVLKHPMDCAILVLSNNSLAFVCHLLAGAMGKIPQQQIKTAHNLGLKKLTIYLHIQLPLAIRSILPYYHNEILMLLKSSSLASSIACLEVTGVVAQLVSQNFQNIKWYCILAVIYVVVACVILALFKVSKMLLMNSQNNLSKLS